jgi:RimJ/RimL family protein N-acetyltransferase
MKIETVTTQATITADRFALRPMRRSDAGLVAHYCADTRVAEASRNIPHPFPPGTAEAMVDRALNPERREDVWVMDGSAQGQSEVLGLITMTHLDRDQSEITYWVAPAFWKTGLATEAVRAVVAANPQKAKHLFAAVFQDHPGTARVLTNCGFDYLGDAEEYCLARKSVLPTWTYSMKLEK